MTERPSHARRNVIPYLALVLVLVVGAGGGYALAASNTKTITVCADKKTGILHLKTHGRCKSSQTRVTWNQEGPQGPGGAPGATGATGAQGAQGSAGAPGPAGVTVWADVGDMGGIAAGSGISVQHLSTGTYQITITDPTCSSQNNAPVISVADTDPGALAGASPTAWYSANGPNQQFMVFTGRIAVTGGFSLANQTFDILDTCS